MHVIRKQIVAVELPAVEEALDLQQRVSRLVQERLRPALGQLFDRLAGPEQLLRLDRLELRVEVASLAALEEQVVGQVLQALTAELQAPAQEAGFAENPGGGFGPGKTPSQKANERTTRSPERAVVPVGEAAFEAFAFFLRQGHLPWWASFGSFGEFTTAVQSYLHAAAPDELKELLHLLLSRPWVVERLVYQFPPELLQKVVRLAGGGAAARVYGTLEKALLATFRGVPVPDLRRERVVQQVRLHFLRGLSDPSFSLPALLHPLFASICKELGDLPGLPQALEEKWKEAGLPESPQSNLSKPAEANWVAAAPALGENQERAPTAEEKDGLYVQNAGLVLLTPFLQTYLQSGGLAKAQALLRPLEAVHWLQYLVTGQTRTPEPELLLNKLLCGLPLSTPVPADILLPPEGQQEARQVLEAVIRHWSALKSTSPEGLRESFLQRFGRLSRKPDGDWLLQVEQKSYDMLLESLPWSFSLVKLPWMPRALWVEWT